MSENNIMKKIYHPYDCWGGDGCSRCGEGPERHIRKETTFYDLSQECEQLQQRAIAAEQKLSRLAVIFGVNEAYLMEEANRRAKWINEAVNGSTESEQLRAKLSEAEKNLKRLHDITGPNSYDPVFDILTLLGGIRTQRDNELAGRRFAEQRVRELEAYAIHRFDCAKMDVQARMGYTKPECTCGLDALKSKLQTKEAPRPITIDECCGNPPGTFAKFCKDHPDPDQYIADQQLKAKAK